MIRSRNEFIIERTRIGTFIKTYDRDIRWKIQNILNKKVREWFPTNLRGSEELVTWRVLTIEEIEEVTEKIQNTKMKGI